MSIISSEAKWAVLQRVVRLSPEEIRGTTKGKEYEAGFIAGATRRPTNEEIVAGAKAFYEALKPDSYPQWDSDCALRAEYYDAMRLAVKARMNLLDETKSAISRSKHSTDDVRFVGSRDEKLGIPWSQAEKVLDIDYDEGYGGQEIAADLVVAFTDGGFLRREEYDGSEWWEYEPPFRVPETQKPFKLVKALSYYTRLLVDINYPMEATEE